MLAITTVSTPCHILKTQGDAVYRRIEKAGLDPAEFEWRETAHQDQAGYIGSDYVTDMLVHRPTDAFFLFGHQDVVCSPGYERLREH